jgi:hypothetical protein
MTIIVALSGKKQSGKTSLSNYLHGHEMQRHDVVKKFFLSPEGNLVVNCTFQDEKGNDFEEMGVLDLQQHNDDFYRYAAKNIWPLIRAYNFADALKEMCVMLFNVPVECVYGTDEQKNQLQEHLLWENMPGVMTQEFQIGCVDWQSYSSYFATEEPRQGPMTAREFMQYLGTDIMRKMYEPIWLENCFRRIEEDKPEIAIIGDCRFMNEIHAVQARGGKVIRLKRSLYECNHQSEIDADNYEGFDDVIENDSMNLQESCDLFVESLIKLGVTKKLREVNKFTASIK